MSQPSDLVSDPLLRVIVNITGSVQGVGFRPFLYRLALCHGVRGKVANDPAGVLLEVEGKGSTVEAFLHDVLQKRPPLAVITGMSRQEAPPLGYSAFVITKSRLDGHRTALIAPDVAVCVDCLREMYDPKDRRYRYPFINCTNCGPRYTIIRELPYDRFKTSMACFTMCPTCQAEYDDPANRRFHAQPNACPNCGPRVWLTTDGQSTEQVAASAIEACAGLLRQGAIAAIKGLGGFHLACDATNAKAVVTLRRRKHREERPLALMVPDLDAAQRLCLLSREAVELLTGPERPIVLAERRTNVPVAAGIAPGLRELGLMLPYTPLHHLLLHGPSGRPRFDALVMTSGNCRQEPIALGNREALERLGGLADAFLLHDRDIHMRCDDTVARPEAARTCFLRRSRGYVPVPVFLGFDVANVLAVGGHFKSTIALSRQQTVFLSQHIGDLENLQTLEFFRQSVRHLKAVLDIHPQVIAHDLHPDYLSTRLALEVEDVPKIGVQHHHAHIAAVMAEHGLHGPVIGIALDGTGYGLEGHLWGGEILIADHRNFRRAAHLAEVRLPGGEQAVREPWRMALAYLDAVFGSALWDLPIPWLRELDRARAELLLRAARKGINSPPTSSCGRLFDAIAALAGGRRTVSFEGQAAMELEGVLARTGNGDGYPVEIDSESSPLLLQSAPIVRGVVEDVCNGTTIDIISARFHHTLVELLAEACSQLARASGLGQVVLSGGCFQNRYLSERLSGVLEQRGLRVYQHQQTPANDGGLALGQVVVASARFAEGNQTRSDQA